MLTKGAYIILGKRLSLIDKSADFTNVSFFTFCLRLGLNVIIVIRICHGRQLRDYACFCYGADEKSVGVKVDIVFYLS